MNAMRDYITPQERIDIFPTRNLKRNFCVEELDNIFYRRRVDNELQEKLEKALRIFKSKRG